MREKIYALVLSFVVMNLSLEAIWAKHLTLKSNLPILLLEGQEENNEKSQDFKQKLHQLLNKEISSKEGRKWINLINSKTDNRISPALKELAELSSKEKYSLVTLDTLRALSRINEPQNYFIDNVKNFKQNGRLAFYSAVILAYDSNEQIVNFLEGVSSQTLNSSNREDSYLRTVTSAAKNVLFLSKEYNKLQGAKIKCNYLIDQIGSGSIGGWYDNDSSEITLRPSKVWTRNKMYELSEQYPDEVAKTIFETDVRKKFEKDLTLLGDKTYGQKEYRKYISNFICLKAKKALYDLVNQARTQDTIKH